MKKFDFIDSLRGIAILMVVIVHCDQYSTVPMPGMLSNIFNVGLTGVQLFFIISSFTIFHSLRSRNSAPDLQFFKRRFFRIAPMYYLGIIYYLLQDGMNGRYWLGDQDKITVLNIISNFTFTHGFYPYHINSIVPGGWTIAVEMMFYLTIPFLFRYIDSLKTAVAVLFSSIVIKAVLYKILIGHSLISDTRLWEEFLSIYFFSQLPYFLLGSVVYFLVVEQKGMVAFWVLAGALVAVIPFVGKDGLIMDYRAFMGLFFATLTYFLSQRPLKVFVNSIFSFFGKISFSMYLTHFAVLHWCSKYGLIDFIDVDQNSSVQALLLNFAIRYFVIVIISGALSFVTYLFVERPFQQLAKTGNLPKAG